MNETQTLRGAVVKTLAIVGFMVTIGGILFVGSLGIKKIPENFSSLASIAQTIQNYRGKDAHLQIATEKVVVNSKEPFQISWTDMGKTGEFTFQYDCISGTHLEVQSTDEKFIPMECTDTLSLPADVHGLFLTAVSNESRFIDIPLTLTFTDGDNDTPITQTTKITIVNATIPNKERAEEIVSSDSTHTPIISSTESVIEDVVTPVSEEPTPANAKKPESNAQTPKLYTDLAITPVAIGTLKNGVFTPTNEFDTDLNNAVQFDVKNIGTATSGTWSFKTILPSGEMYQSPTQVPLLPSAHVTFTLGFYLDESYAGETVLTTHSLSIQKEDVELINNNVTQRIPVAR